MITPSKAHWIDKCLYALRDDVPRKPEGTVHPRATLGTLVHRMVHSAVIFGSGEPPAVDDPEAMGMARNALKWIWAQEATWSIVVCEAGFLYDARTDAGHLGPSRGEPGYDTAPSGCTRGTWDIVLRRKDAAKQLRAIDIKTGKYENAHPEQLRMQGVAASRVLGSGIVEVAFLFVRKTKSELRHEDVMFADELDAEAGRLYSAARRLPMAKPTPGDHCYRCDIGRDFCPAWGFSEEQGAA